MQFDKCAAVGALENLLDHEREMILAGRLDDLGRTEQEKARLITQVTATSDHNELDVVRQKAQRNQKLLQAALRGLSAAKERIRHWSQAPKPLRTYGADGTAGEIDLPQGREGMNRRA